MKEEKQLSKEEVLQIPKLVESMRIGDIADSFGVSRSSIKHWIAKLRKIGYEVKTKKGRKGLLETNDNSNEAKS